MEKQFKPMLAPNEKIDLSTIQYPILASYKLDGIRCIFKDGEMLSRSLKPIRNKKLQERFQFLKDLSKTIGILDGEIYSSELTFQEIQHFVMKEDIGDEILPEHLMFYCFDWYDVKTQSKFSDRVLSYKLLLLNKEYVYPVKQTEVTCEGHVNMFFKEALKYDFEGLILKDPNGRYKFGRGTVREGLIYKVKPFKTYDLPIIEVYERVENTSESKINELGNKQKARCQADMIPTGIAGGFVVEYNGFKMKVTATGDEAFRRKIWENRESHVGDMIEFKAMEVGSKDVLRHPVFIRFREDKK